MKIKELLKYKSTIDIKEKRLLLSFLLHIKPLDLIIKESNNVNFFTEIRYKLYVNKLEKGKYLEHIIKNKNFYGYDFYVDKNVLVPRVETENLIKYTNDYIKQYFSNNIKILDVGTGSGIIAIILKKLNESYDVTAVDISKKALVIASKNAKKLNTSINFINSNMLINVTDKYDVLISNPPYLKKDANHVEEKVLKNDPKIALFGGEDGLKFYIEILRDAKKVLNDKNIIAFEIGYDQAKKIQMIAKRYFPDAKIE